MTYPEYVAMSQQLSARELVPMFFSSGVILVVDIVGICRRLVSTFHVYHVTGGRYDRYNNPPL